MTPLELSDDHDDHDINMQAVFSSNTRMLQMNGSASITGAGSYSGEELSRAVRLTKLDEALNPSQMSALTEAVLRPV
jgi:hypothetical protein